MDTLRELRDAALQEEFALARAAKASAGRVIDKYGAACGWSPGEIQEMKDMLGLDLAPTLGTTNWTGRNSQTQ